MSDIEDFNAEKARDLVDEGLAKNKIRKIMIGILQDIKNTAINNREYELEITNYLSDKDYKTIKIIKMRLKNKGFSVYKKIKDVYYCSREVEETHYFVNWEN
jgi:hypothetical protein